MSSLFAPPAKFSVTTTTTASRSKFNPVQYLKSSLLVSPWTWLVAFATVIGAFGGFPPAPKAFLWLTEWQIIQWLLVFVLVYQGGGGEDPLFALVITLITFIVYKVLTLFEKKTPAKEPEADADVAEETA